MHKPIKRQIFLLCEHDIGDEKMKIENYIIQFP